MPVSSYIIYPVSGQEVVLEKKLRDMSYVSVFPDDAKKIFVLVTDTPDSETESFIQEKLEKMPEILCTAVSFVSQPQDEIFSL